MIYPPTFNCLIKLKYVCFSYRRVNSHKIGELTRMTLNVDEREGFWSFEELLQYGVVAAHSFNPSCLFSSSLTLYPPKSAGSLIPGL